MNKPDIEVKKTDTLKVHYYLMPINGMEGSVMVQQIEPFMLLPKELPLPFKEWIHLNNTGDLTILKDMIYKDWRNTIEVEQDSEGDAVNRARERCRWSHKDIHTNVLPSSHIMDSLISCRRSHLSGTTRRIEKTKASMGSDLSMRNMLLPIQSALLHMIYPIARQKADSIVSEKWAMES